MMQSMTMKMIMMMNNPTTMSPSKCWYVGNVVQNAAANKLQRGMEVEIMVAGECGPDVVTIRVHDHNGEETMVRVRRTMCMSILHRPYAHRKGVEREALLFLLYRDPLDEHETADTFLEFLIDGDTIVI
ncbi:hypothetical protein N9140_00650 [bacterium]|nr:hypothetical protein [bacterium]